MGNQFTMDELYGDQITSPGEPHLACALLLDTSGSMGYGLNPAINSLNEGIKKFKESVSSDPIARNRVDVALVTFNSSVEVISDFTPITQMPTPDLRANGLTQMAEGIHAAIDLVKNRTAMYQAMGTPCHKPWIFLITDGESTSAASDMVEAAERIQEEELKGSHGRLAFWALGINEYNKEQLFGLTKRVLELKDENFEGIFDWLSESMSCISQSRVGENIEFDPLPENARKAREDRTIDEGWQ